MANDEPPEALAPAPETQAAPVAKAPQTRLEWLMDALAPFRECHPYSEIAEIVLATGNVPVVNDPWGDSSLVIRIPDNADALIAALNNVLMPTRFTAIWHKDTRDFEIIWTAYPPPPIWNDIPGREFKFRYVGVEYKCEFAASSGRLLEIARHYTPARSSDTNFRNLDSFRHHVRWGHLPKDKRPPGPPDTAPLSFWIRNIEWNEDKILTLANNLNFYLTYYDNFSPVIVIHSPGTPKAIKPQTRYPHGNFPAHIEGRVLDDVLLQLWIASRSGDEARRFLYCFRIIEYASFSYLDAKARLEVRRILAMPHALDNITQVTDSLVDALQKAKLDDFPKFESLLEDTVKPSLLWREIDQNFDAFSSSTEFDGGFKLKALIPVGTTEDQFALKGIENFHKAIREIRNALAHGRDSKSAAVITPTVRNFQRLRPWVSLISVAATDVILFKNLI